jgi:TRAP-type mannitol/chloroaromatic compound transport system permease large subunit
MSRRALIPLCLILVLLLGGQVFSQTRLTVKTVCYVAETFKALPVDKDHLVLVSRLRDSLSKSSDLLKN